MMRDESAAARSARVERTEAALADLGSLLSGSFGYEEALRGLASFAVRSIADICVVDVVENDVVRRVHVATADARQAEIARELLRFPLDRGRPHLSLEALSSGHPQIVHDITTDLLDATCQGAEHREILEKLGPRSFMAVPLAARDQLLGVVLFVSCGAPYEEEDLTLADRLVRLAALQVDNARLYREAREALLARDRVLGIVAHDLRNPLNVISMSAGLLAGGGLSEVQESAQVQMIARSASRMNRLIQDLLDVARIEAGGLNLQREPQDAAQLARDAVELNSALARAKTLTMECSVGVRIPPISADRDRILQVLSNLLGNTIKFTPEGGRIEVSLRREGDEAVFSVSDTGPGIAPEDLANLFQPFWQAQRSGTEGAGLGLSIARGIVEGHGGRIWAESSPGDGSTFHFTIPLHVPGPARERRHGAPDRRGARRGSAGSRMPNGSRAAAHGSN